MSIANSAAFSSAALLVEFDPAKVMNSNNRQVTVMDGSMGRQLCLEGLPQGELFHKIWAASALADPAYHELVVSTLQSDRSVC